MQPRFKYFILIFTLLPFIAAAQTVIKGSVLDNESGRPVVSAIVSVLDAASEVVAYDITLEEGKFSLSVTYTGKEITLLCRALGYREQLQTLSNKHQTVALHLEQTGIELQEVTIKSKPINVSEDTLRYSVNTFKSASDRTIGDILKKLPGIEVSESGGIKYQGEPINKFYIEGLDLLESRYGIATNNVPVDAVLNVEVIENHQPIKSIKGMISSAQAAINLKLKEEKMARPVGGVRTGGGYSDRINWLLEAFALQASKKHQAIGMYKTNNTGTDISSDLNEQSLSVQDLQSPGSMLERHILSPPSPNAPPIEKERFLFNKSHVASINNLWKTGEESQLKVNVNYLNDIQHENTYRKSEYFLPDSLFYVTETNELKIKKQQLDGTLAYTSNGQRSFLENTLKLKVRQDDFPLFTELNNEHIRQKTEQGNALINNQLNYLHRWDDKIINIGSFISYSSQPELLRIHRYDNTELQTVEKNNFYSKTGSYYSWFWGRSGLRITGELETSINSVNTELISYLFADSLTNNYRLSTVKIELSPLYTYKTEKTELQIELPIKQYFYSNINRQNTTTQNEQYFLVNSRISLSHKFNPYLNTILSYKFSQNTGEYTDFLDAYLMKGLRTYYKPTGLISLRKSQSATLSVHYKNPLNSLFGNASISYLPTESNKTFANRFIGYQIVGTEQMLRNKSEMWFFRLYLGKYFSSVKTNVSFSGQSNHYRSSRFQQGILYPFVSRTFSAGLKSNTKFSDLFSLVYQFNYLNNQSKIQTVALNHQSGFSQINQQLKGYISKGKNIELSGTIEHSYNETGSNSHVDMLFAHVGVKYKFKSADLELYWNNIFNSKEYAYSLLSEFDSYTFRHRVRPMGIIAVVSFKF